MPSSLPSSHESSVVVQSTFLVIGDWLYEHFEAYVPDPDRGRPGTAHGTYIPVPVL
jgi:hypothetical protein